MTKTLRTVVFSVLALLLLTLCGCGTQTENTMSIDRGFSGYRVIDCTVSQDALKSQLPDGEASVDFLLDKSCPSSLNWEKTAQGDGLLYRFTLSFDSLDDYTRKISSLLGREPSIEFSAPDGIFTQGFRLKEDFSAAELLQWLTDAARKEALLSEGTVLFSSGTTTLYYEGQAYPSKGDCISVQNFSYLPIDKITLSTKLKFDGSLERTAAFQLPQSTCDQLSSTLEGYMNSRVPAGGKGQWSALSTGRLFTVTFSAKDARELEEKTAVLLDTPASETSLSREQDSIFSKQLVFEESADFSSFLSGRHGKTFVEYSFETDNSSGLSGAQIWKDGAWRDASAYLENGSFTLYGDQSRLRLRIQSDVSYALDALSLHMAKTGENTYQRELQFVFTGPGARVGARHAADYFEKSSVSGASVSQEGSACTLTLSGALPEINAALEAFFGEGNRLSLQTAEGFALFHKTAVEDRINLSGFCEQAGFSGEISYLYTDEAGTPLITRTFSPGDAVSFSAEKRWLNQSFAAVLAGLCLAIFAALLTVFLLLRRRHQENKPLTRDPGGKALRPLDLVCPYCGAQLYSGMEYCTGCGRTVDYLAEEAKQEEP